MSVNLNLEETLKDASDEEIKDFILSTLLELLDLASLLRDKKEVSINGLH
jgi:hypothetical protein